MILEELALIASIVGLPLGKASKDDIDRVCRSWVLPLPVALKDYYLTFGLDGPASSERYACTPVANINGHGDLIFARFANQTKENGVLESDRTQFDPPVYERDIGTKKWFDGGRSLASCLINCAAWEGLLRLPYRHVFKYTQKRMRVIEEHCHYIGGKTLNYAFIYFRSLAWSDKPVLVCTYMSAQIVIGSMDLTLVEQFRDLVET